MGKFKDLLENQELLFLDGALGTELEAWVMMYLVSFGLLNTY